MKKIIKKIWIISVILGLSVLLLPNQISIAEDDLSVEGFNIIPELDEDQIANVNAAISGVWAQWWEVRKEYNIKAGKLKTSEQLASWIMNRDTIMNYLVFVIQFLSQLWLLVWVIFIMYAWYKYMVSVFESWKTPSSTIKNAIIWVLIIIFSYAIMRIFTSIIWLT